VWKVITENYRTKTLVLDLRLDAQPGQYVLAWIPGLNQKPFSLAGVNPVMLTVARVGPFSSALHEMGPGDRVGITGPFGQGFSMGGRRALLVGGGYGAAPLAYLAEVLLGAGRAVTVALGARSAGDLLLMERFEHIGISPLLATDDGSCGVQGRVTVLAEPLVASGAVDTLYACGPHCMLEALEQLSLASGVPAQLSWEARVNCGIGVCGACGHRGLRLCTDGPVLQAGSGQT
jgi:dihydroorotate dehydrogenase electron transfer subunit